MFYIGGFGINMNWDPLSSVDYHPTPKKATVSATSIGPCLLEDGDNCSVRVLIWNLKNTEYSTTLLYQYMTHVFWRVSFHSLMNRHISLTHVCCWYHYSLLVHAANPCTMTSEGKSSAQEHIWTTGYLLVIEHGNGLSLGNSLMNGYIEWYHWTYIHMFTQSDL